MDKHGFEFPLKIMSQPQTFISAVRKLLVNEKYPSVKSAYKAKRIVDALEVELKTYLKLLEEYRKNDAADKMTELNESTVKIKWDKFTAEELAGINFSPAELGVIEHLGDVESLLN